MHPLQRIQRYRQITVADEHALARRIKEGDRRALEDLVGSALAEAASIAGRYRDMGIPPEDLVSASGIALIKAAQRYDPEVHGRFAPHASWWIRQEITAELARSGRSVSLPPKVYKRSRRLLRRIDRLEQEKGRAVGLGEAAEELQIAPELLDEINGMIQEDCSLDDPAEGAEEPGMTMLDTLVYDDDPLPSDIAEANTVREKVRYAVSALPPREREIITLTFGLAEKVLTTEEAGVKLGLSANRARQVRKRALEKLRSMPVMRFFGSESPAKGPNGASGAR